MANENLKDLSFFARLGTGISCALRALSSPAFARQAAALLAAGPAPAPPAPAPAPRPVAPPPEKTPAAGLQMLALLQREGRLIDFLQEDVASFPDADVGAAARVVHEGCRKVLRQSLTLAPVLAQSEGDTVTVPIGFDAQRIRLTGNVAGQPPFRGALKHHGWVATEIRLPQVAESLDARVLAPAEVELG